MDRLRLSVFPGRLSVFRLNPGEPLPDWVLTGSFYAVTRTPEELSIVCEADRIPEGIPSVAGWRALKVEGPLDFALIGILAGIAGTLADAGISLFAISTFDTDYILVREGDLPRAIQAIRGRGYIVL